jgi:hypothetical protein
MGLSRSSSFKHQVSNATGVAMKKCVLLIVLTMIFFTGPCFAQAPHEIAGFILNHDINDYKEIIRQKTELPIRFMDYLREVEIKKIVGFKSGLITFGTCTKPGRIVRIKLKYENSSKTFFDALLKKFKKQFGEPSEWRGDPFHIVIAWKWSFTDKDGNKISLNLQHNTKDVEEKLGNSVKLTMTSAIEEEQRCFEKKYPETEEDDNKDASDRRLKSNDWQRFIPH